MRRKIIGIILVIIGICILVAAVYIRMYGSYKQKQMMNSFERSISKEAGPQNQNSDVSTQTKPQEDTYGAVGIIVIPKINLKVAIGEGTDMDTLKYAVGHFKGTAMPGEVGNCCIAGHRSYTYSEYFNRLDEVQIGDIIILRTKTGEFQYKIFSKDVVLPSQYSVLNPTKDAELTLVTCTPIRVATHRLIIKAKLQGK